MLAMLLQLGFWQLERAIFKEQMQAQASKTAGSDPELAHELLQSLPQDAWYFHPVLAKGTFDAQHQYLFDNRTLDGIAGYHVLSVITYGTNHLLVNRGWVPVGPDRRILPDVRIRPSVGPASKLSTTGPVAIRGHLATLPGSGILLGETGYNQPGWPKVVQSVDLARMREQLGVALLPALMLLDPQHPACLQCRWQPAKGISAQRHRGYAAQWFLLALALVVLLSVVAYFGFRKHVE